MKRFLAVVAVSVLVLAGAVASDTIRVSVNGKQLSLNGVPPLEVAGRIMVPLRAVAEGLGAKVEARESSIEVKKDTKTVALRIASDTATVNGAPMKLDALPMRWHGSVYVPLRFVAEAFGVDVKWDDSARLVCLTDPPSGVQAAGMLPAFGEKRGPVTAMPQVPKVAILPWVLLDCTNGGRAVAKETLIDVFHAVCHEVVDEGRVRAVCQAVLGYNDTENPMRPAPTLAQMTQIGQVLGADLVCSGRIVWRTKTIWTWRGPSTKAYTKLDAMLVDANKGDAILTPRGVEADSEERCDLRAAAGWLVSPLAWLSAGPKDPHHRRAAQLVIVKAFNPWIQSVKPKPGENEPAVPPR